MAFTERDLKDAAAVQRARRLFDQAGFLRHCGVHLADVGPGWAESTVALGPHLTQADGFAHAGLQATMADHTAGIAAGTLVSASEVVLAVEFKINLLRPGIGETLRCRAEVIRAGKRLIFTEAKVYAHRGTAQVLTATFMSTLAVTALDPKKG